MQLKPNEAVLLWPDDEPLYEDEWKDSHNVDTDAVFTCTLATGRTWESETVEGGGSTIRTKPDPQVRVYDLDNRTVVALAVPLPNPLVFHALVVSHGDIEDFLARLVRGVEDGYDGIEQVAQIRAEDGYTTLSTAVEEEVEAILSTA